MNTTDNPLYNGPARPDPARLMPDEPRERPDAVEATNTPHTNASPADSGTAASSTRSSTRPRWMTTSCASPSGSVSVAHKRARSSQSLPIAGDPTSAA